MSLTLGSVAKIKKTREGPQEQAQSPAKREQVRPWQTVEKEHDLIDIYLEKKSQKFAQKEQEAQNSKAIPTKQQKTVTNDDKVADQIKLRAKIIFQNIKN